MTTLTMYDADINSQFPPGAPAYAAYVDGNLGDQPNYAYIVREFPRASHLSIALFPENDADTLDVETGAASPADIPAWHARQKARGVQRPCVYASASTMQARVLPVLHAAGISRESVRLWSAHYLAGEHICGPSTCKLVDTGMDGTQWDDAALGRDLDQSVLLPDFFGAPQPPQRQWTEFDVARLPVLRQGDRDVPGRGFFWVVRLQDELRRTGMLEGIAEAKNLPPDGNFGPLTTAAVKAVQKHYRITVDGVAGSQTRGVLLTGSPG